MLVDGNPTSGTTSIEPTLISAERIDCKLVKLFDIALSRASSSSFGSPNAPILPTSF
jgi:hypothetical protein